MLLFVHFLGSWNFNPDVSYLCVCYWACDGYILWGQVCTWSWLYKVSSFHLSQWLGFSSIKKELFLLYLTFCGPPTFPFLLNWVLWSAADRPVLYMSCGFRSIPSIYYWLFWTLFPSGCFILLPLITSSYPCPSAWCGPSTSLDALVLGYFKEGNVVLLVSSCIFHVGRCNYWSSCVRFFFQLILFGFCGAQYYGLPFPLVVVSL